MVLEEPDGAERGRPRSEPLVVRISIPKKKAMLNAWRYFKPAWWDCNLHIAPLPVAVL